MVVEPLVDTTGTSRVGPNHAPPGPDEVVLLDIDALVLEGSPRLGGEDAEHTRRLAEGGAKLPPILVHWPTMRVLDGMHRVQAARRNGRCQIDARLFNGDDSAAFVRAVEANIRHGLPLTLRDRRTAAARIVSLHPEWSDRTVAESSGLAAKTVSGIRAALVDSAGWRNVRVGRDGRVRPVDPAEGRRRAAEILTERPDTPLRELARFARVSLGTARDVRRRVRNGDDPLPPRMRGGQPNGRTTGNAPGRRMARRSIGDGDDEPGSPPSRLLDNLRKDPSLRYSEKGRAILRWLDSKAVDPADWSRLTDGLPDHCRYTLVELALGCARAWQQLAQEVRPHLVNGRSGYGEPVR